MKYKSLKHFLVLFLALVVIFCISLPVRSKEASTGQSNIINGGFEEPKLIEVNPSTNYKIVNSDTVAGWQTTAIDKAIEFGWMRNGESAHMVPTKTAVIIGEGASDGVQFAELTPNDISSLYQTISLSAGRYYDWTVHHRGRAGNDTFAIIITDDDNKTHVKPNKEDYDHFRQILNWMRTNGVTAPAAGEVQNYTVYTTILLDGIGFTESSSGSYFSYIEDEEHQVKFEIQLITTAKTSWREYTGTYYSDVSKKIIFALTPFSSSSGVTSNSGNLVDNCSFKDSHGNELLINAGFEDYVITKGYLLTNGANSSQPTAGIGWCTTAYDYKVEIGNLDRDNSYGIDIIREETVLNPPSIREGLQFAELNANEASSLYQIVETEPGKMYRWSLSHRGRSGADTMALIIGPNQQYLPKKASKTSRDQMMKIVDWINNQTDIAWDIPMYGCSEKITVYTPKFDDNGGFTDNNNSFSIEKTETHTEEWSIWIITSKNDQWHDYGEIDLNAKYEYEYIVPQGYHKSVFGFVSINSTGSSSPTTYGNLLDNIAFKEYYYIDVVNASNSGDSQLSIRNEDNSFIFDDENEQDSGWAFAGSDISIHIKKGKREIIGTYINGVFVSISEWQFDSETNEYTYHLINTSAACRIDVIYVANKIVYDTRNQYDYDGPNGSYEFSLGHDSLSHEYISHAPKKYDDGWEFVGWQFFSSNDSNTYLFDAVHLVRYVEDVNHLDGEKYEYFQICKINEDNSTEVVVDKISYDEGITFFAVWRYRQRIVFYAYNQNTADYEKSTYGGHAVLTVMSGDSQEKRDFIIDGQKYGEEVFTSDDSYINLTAYRYVGYSFNGWYNESGELVSKSVSYSYRVGANKVVNLRAYFEPVGYNISIECLIKNSSAIDKYFAINCSFTNLRENKVYVITDLNTDAITIDGKEVANPTRLRADENGNAEITIYMKANDKAEILFLPENAVVSIISKDYTHEGYSVLGEVQSKVLSTHSQEKLIYLFVTQSMNINPDKHFSGINSGLDPDSINITNNSSFTLDVITQYNPYLFTNLQTYLRFFDLSLNPKVFPTGTRILLIDFTNANSPKYYKYIVESDVSTIKLEEKFVELNGNTLFHHSVQGDLVINERLIFIIDYIGAQTVVESGKISIEYKEDTNHLNNAINPLKKNVMISTDQTNIDVLLRNDGNYSSSGPFIFDLDISNDLSVVNTVYEEEKYLVNITIKDGFPTGTYAIVNGKYFYSHNGNIIISPLLVGKHKVEIYSPLPIGLTDGKNTISVEFLPYATQVSNTYTFVTKTGEISCIDTNDCAIDASIPNYVLSEGIVSNIDLLINYQNIDSIKLMVYKKNKDGSLSYMFEENNIALPQVNQQFVLSLNNRFNVTKGETYIIVFNGYLQGVLAVTDQCYIVIGY